MVTAVIVAFIFVGLSIPHLVKRRPPFYAALGLILIVILFDSIGHTTSLNGAFSAFIYLINALLQIVAIVMLVLSTAGQSLGELAGEVGKSIDSVRYGAAAPPPAAAAAAPAAKIPAQAPAAATSATRAPGGPAAAPAAPAAKPRTIAMPPRKPRDDTSIPMD
jgi:hypothetical protein